MDREPKPPPRGASGLLDRESKFLIRKICLDFFILCCVGFPILFFFLWGKPYERGFFCDDESLKHPYKDSTVTNVMLYIVGLALPCTTMILTEFVQLRNYATRARTLLGRDVPPWLWEAYRALGVFLFGVACQQLTTDIAKYSVGRLRPHFFMILTEFVQLRNYATRARTLLGRDVPPWLWEAYRALGVFLFGVACQQLTTDIAKYSVGRLRPHFFAVCNPDVNCTLEANRWRYIVDFTCLGDQKRLQKEMRLSFPSGHSSFSAYTMLYFAMYIHKRFSWKGSKLLRHGIQFVLLMMTWYTVLTRVSDYKHHWSDVLAGFSIGIIYAVVVFTFASGLRRSPKHRATSTHHESEMRTTNGGARHV